MYKNSEINSNRLLGGFFFLCFLHLLLEGIKYCSEQTPHTKRQLAAA